MLDIKSHRFEDSKVLVSYLKCFRISLNFAICFKELFIRTII